MSNPTAAAVLPSESILKTISKMVDADGLAGTDEYYLFDLTIHINTFILDLYQCGIGAPGFTVTDENQTWADYLGPDLGFLQAAKDYIYLQCKLIFDPPASSSVQKAMQDTCDRIIYRLRSQKECTTL